jgi:hypothetical protein
MIYAKSKYVFVSLLYENLSAKEADILHNV